MVKSLANTLTSKENQAWILNTILTDLSMQSKVSQARTVKLLVRWVTQNVSKRVSSKIFQEIKTNTSLRQRLNTLLENNRVPSALSNDIFQCSSSFKELENLSSH